MKSSTRNLPCIKYVTDVIYKAVWLCNDRGSDSQLKGCRLDFRSE